MGLCLQEQQFQHEVQRIKLEYDIRMEELKIVEMNQRVRVEQKLASIELRHQFATCRRGEHEAPSKPPIQFETVTYEWSGGTSY